MRRLWLGLGCALLAGCADFFKPSDDREPLPVLSALDSAAIAKMKISMGVWNGDVRDWINVYTQTGRVKSLEIVAALGRAVEFPDTGLENVEVISIRVAADTLKVDGFSRLPSVVSLTCLGSGNYRLKAWPRGVYMNENVSRFSVGGSVIGIEDSLMNLVNLQILDVAGNDISSLPDWIYLRNKFSILVFDNHLCDVDSLQMHWLDLHATAWKSQRCP